MNTILIKNIYCENKRKDVFIKDGKIDKIGDSLDFNADRIIDGKNKAIIPGFYNMHTHAAMSLLRGYKDDVKLFDWLNAIWEIEDHLEEEDMYWGTKLACLEMIKSGTTCFLDQYWMINTSAQAIKEMGMRACLSYTFMDAGNKEKAEFNRKTCEKAFEDSKKWDSRIQFAVGTHSIYTVCEENLKFTHDFARANNILEHIHVAETEVEYNESIKKYGLSPVQYLDSLGALSDSVVAAHCVWLNEKDIKLLGERGVTVTHNPNSNLKLGSGYRFLYNELKAAGANVTIGTDGCGSSNNLDLLEAMKTASLLQKGWRGDATALPINEILNIGTVNGAKALHLNGGKIEEGALADLCIIDLNSSRFVPNYNFESNLIYSANSSCIETVICDGKIIMEDRQVPGEQEIIDNSRRVVDKLWKYKKN